MQKKKTDQAYEDTIAAWTAFRPTFARLSINVTAHFGTAPANTTTPGLDPNPPPPGTSLPLTFSEEADPIYDEEGDAGGLPNYDPLKLGERLGLRGFPRFDAVCCGGLGRKHT